MMTSSQLACQLSWQSTAPLSQRSWVQIPHRPEFFFRPYFHYYLSSVHNCQDGFHICFFSRTFTYMIFIQLQSFIHQFKGLFGTNIMTRSQLACLLSWQSTTPVLQRSWVQILYKLEFFFQALFSPLLKLRVHNCKDHFHIHFFNHCSHI